MPTRNPWPSRSAAFSGMLSRGQAGGDGGGGGTQQSKAESGGDPSAGKGPKGFFRSRVVPCRKLVALLAVGLCVLAGKPPYLGLQGQRYPMYSHFPNRSWFWYAFSQRGITESQKDGERPEEHAHRERFVTVEDDRTLCDVGMTWSFDAQTWALEMRNLLDARSLTWHDKTWKSTEEMQLIAFGRRQQRCGTRPSRKERCLSVRPQNRKRKPSAPPLLALVLGTQRGW